MGTIKERILNLVEFALMMLIIIGFVAIALYFLEPYLFDTSCSGLASQTIIWSD